MEVDYSRIEKIVRYSMENPRGEPSLFGPEDIAGFAPDYVDGLFNAWAGVGLNQFMSNLTPDALKRSAVNFRKLIASSKIDAEDSGIDIENVSNENITTIKYGFAGTPYGKCFIATVPQGICRLHFVDDNAGIILESFAKEWPGANLTRNDNMAAEIAEQIFVSRTSKLSVCVRGTPFQIKVWQSLVTIPYGCVATYTDLAALAGASAESTRAVASVVAKNPVGCIIPCHRIIRSEGAIGEFFWKSERKACMIGREKVIGL